MDAAQALADLTEISSQVEQVAIVDRDGSLLATTVRDAPRAARLVAGIARLLDEADRLAPGPRPARADPARGLDARGQRLRRPARRPADRRYDPARPDGGARLLRPQALPRQHRGRPRRTTHRADAPRKAPARRRRRRRTPLRKSMTAVVLVAGSLAGSVLYRRRSAGGSSASSCTATTARWSRFAEGSDDSSRCSR